MNRRSGNKKTSGMRDFRKKPLKIKGLKLDQKGIKKGKRRIPAFDLFVQPVAFRTWFLPISISERMQETEEDLRVVDRGLGICAMAQDL